jgi:hypothetical protein
MRRGWTVLIATGAVWILICSFGGAGAEDNYVHTFTGFTFPPKVTDFTRTRVTPYNDAKSDIQVDYENQPFTCLLSSYVYPATGTLHDHYAKCKADVTTVHPGAQLLKEMPLRVDKSGAAYDGLEAIYAMNEAFGSAQRQPLLSRLILFRRGDYWVFYRITYTKASAAVTEKQIDAFLQAFQWPQGVPLQLENASHP